MPSLQSLISTSIVVAALVSPSTQYALERRQADPTIDECVNGQVALTFDDGPWENGNLIMDKLAASGNKATFFVNGDNYGLIGDFKAQIQRIIKDGHQLASHTYSHANLTNATDAKVESELTRLEDALYPIVGKAGTYLRAPYLEYDDRVDAIVKKLGYKTIGVSLDTNDWKYQTNDTIQQSIDIFTKGFAPGKIVLAHETHLTTATFLLDAMIKTLAEKGIKSVTAGKCIGDPEKNWYRTTPRTGKSSAGSGVALSGSKNSSSSWSPSSWVPNISAKGAATAGVAALAAGVWATSRSRSSAAPASSKKLSSKQKSNGGFEQWNPKSTKATPSEKKKSTKSKSKAKARSSKTSRN